MTDSSTPAQPADTGPPSETNPQCKVCTSPDRFEIEVALARGQSQTSVANRYSHSGQTFSRQNINAHYHKHMQVIGLAVAEEVARRGPNPMLDLNTATDIHAQNERNRALMRAQVAKAIEDGAFDWKPREAMAFMEMDARIEEQRNDVRAANLCAQAHGVNQALLRVVPKDLHPKIVEAYEEVMGSRLGTEWTVLLSTDELDEQDQA
jgi:hypothetical protein